MVLKIQQMLLEPFEAAHTLHDLSSSIAKVLHIPILIVPFVVQYYVHTYTHIHAPYLWFCSFQVEAWYQSTTSMNW